MATVSTEFDLKLKVTETLDLAVGSTVTNPKAVRNLLDTGVLDANSTPATTDSWSDTLDLVGGTLTIALDALPNGNLPDKNFTGKRIIGFKFKPVTGNSAAIEVAPAVTDGYPIFGTADDKISLHVGDTEVAVRKDATLLPNVLGGSVSDITFTGSGTDSIEVILVAGN